MAATLGLTLVLHGAAVGAELGTAPSSPTPQSPGWLERDTLAGDWGGGRTWLREHGISLQLRLTQFYQGLASGDGDHAFEYGGKADLLL